MKRLIFLGLITVMMFSTASADSDDSIGSKIAQTCGEDYEPIVSMAHPNKTFNNIGHPSFYDYKVCVRGLVESKIAKDCQGAVAFYISSNTTKAHFAKEKGYNLEVCTGNIKTTLSNTCGTGSLPLFTVSDKINGFGRHVAGLHPGNRYDTKVCAVYSEPENVTLTMEFNLSSNDDVYFDDQKIEGEFEDSSIAEYPYIIATTGDTFAGLVMKDYKTISRKINNVNKYEVKRAKEDATYYIPFSSGDKDDLELTQEEFFSGEIDSGFNPSFGFDVGGTPVVRAIARQEDVTIVTNLSVGSGEHNIQIEKTGDNEITIRER